MAVGFLNREGKQIPKSEWQELRADESYKQVRRYDNGAVNVDLVRISVNVPTHSGLSCPLAHEMVLRG